MPMHVSVRDLRRVLKHLPPDMEVSVSGEHTPGYLTVGTGSDAIDILTETGLVEAPHLSRKDL